MDNLKVEINLYDLALMLDDQQYNDFIVGLFKGSNDDTHVSIMKRLYEIMYESDKKDFAKWLFGKVLEENKSDF